MFIIHDNNTYTGLGFIILTNWRTESFMLSRLIKSTQRSQSEDFLLSGGTVHQSGDH